LGQEHSDGKKRISDRSDEAHSEPDRVRKAETCYGDGIVTVEKGASVGHPNS
jgi:hypothetical protein